MNLIVKEHANTIAKPTVKTYKVVVTPSSYGCISTTIGLQKGDIIVFTGESDAVRLPVGEDGQILTADSSTDTGLAWVDPS